MPQYNQTTSERLTTNIQLHNNPTHTPFSAPDKQLTDAIHKQIHLNIHKQMGSDNTSYKVKLHPAELGQLDIKLEFMQNGRVQTTIHVEQERTLHLLQRDMSNLERTLRDAGIAPQSSDINLSLKDQKQQPSPFSFNHTMDHSDQEQQQMPDSNNSDTPLSPNDMHLSQEPSQDRISQQLQMTLGNIDINV